MPAPLRPINPAARGRSRIRPANTFADRNASYGDSRLSSQTLLIQNGNKKKNAGERAIFSQSDAAMSAIAYEPISSAYRRGGMGNEGRA
jgi:hypothetical protein